MKTNCVIDTVTNRAVSFHRGRWIILASYCPDICIKICHYNQIQELANGWDHVPNQTMEQTILYSKRLHELEKNCLNQHDHSLSCMLGKELFTK